MLLSSSVCLDAHMAPVTIGPEHLMIITESLQHLFEVVLKLCGFIGNVTQLVPQIVFPKLQCN